MTFGKSVGRHLRSVRSVLQGSVIFAASLFSAQNAYAVSDRVKTACRNDYFQHCSQYAVGSDELRQCMRKVGEDLSTPCLVALVQEGEITKEDVERHNAAKAAGGKSKPRETVGKNADDPKDVSATSKKHKTAKKKKRTKKAVAAAERANSASASGDTAEKSVKTAKPGKSGTKTTSAKISGKKKKKHKKSNSKATSAASAPSGTAGTPGTKILAQKSKKHHPTKTKAGAKKKSAGTIAKKKKTSKKKESAKHAARPVDAEKP